MATTPPTPAMPADARESTRATWGARLALAVLLALQLTHGLYGIAQPIAWGHQGYHAGEYGTAAHNLRRYGSWIPTFADEPGPPPRDSLNFHHPFLLHPYIALTQSVFGEAPWAARIVPLTFSLFAVAGLWALARRARGVRTATVATAVFVLDPLNVAYANLPDHQIVAIAYALWACVGMWETFRRPRAPAIALWLGCGTLAGLTDWPWYPTALVLFVMGAYALRANAPTSDPPGANDRRRLRVVLGVFAAITVATFAQHFVTALALHRFHDIRGAFLQRAQLLSARATIEYLFRRLNMMHTLVLPVVAIAWLAGVAFPRRREVDTGLLAALIVGPAIHMAVFRNEVSMHEYRSYWFAPGFALACADGIAVVSERVRAKLANRRARNLVQPLLAAALIGWLAPHAATMLVRSRQTAGSVGMANYHYDPHTGDLLAARATHALAAPNARVFVGGALEARREMFWVLDHPYEILSSVDPIEASLQEGHPFVAVDRVDPVRDVPAWRRPLRYVQVLLIGNAVVAMYTPGRRATIEAAAIATPGTRHGLDAWVHASRAGDPVLVPGDPEVARRFASAIHAPPWLLDSIERHETPLLDALPACLRRPNAPRAPVCIR